MYAFVVSFLLPDFTLPSLESTMTLFQGLLSLAITYLRSKTYFSLPTFHPLYPTTPKSQSRPPYSSLTRKGQVRMKPFNNYPRNPTFRPFRYPLLAPRNHFNPVTQLIKQQQKHIFSNATYSPNWSFATGHSLLRTKYKDMSDWNVDPTQEWISEKQREDDDDDDDDGSQSQSSPSSFYSAHSYNHD